MRMNLSQVLALAGASKPIYDARRRHPDGLWHWMNDVDAYVGATPAVHEYETGRDRYGLDHALGIAVSLALSEIGLSPADADYVVGNRFPDLRRAIAGQGDGPGIEPEGKGAWDGAGNVHVGMFTYPDPKRRLHVFGTLATIVAEFHAESVDGEGRTRPDADRPCGLVTVDATMIFRRLKAKLLSGLGI